MSFHLNELPAPVSPDDVASDFFPLSFAQERLWFLDELDPGQTSLSHPLCRPARSMLMPSAGAWAARIAPRSPPDDSHPRRGQAARQDRPGRDNPTRP
jgi:hypothetical protein